MTLSIPLLAAISVAYSALVRIGNVLSIAYTAQAWTDVSSVTCKHHHDTTILHQTIATILPRYNYQHLNPKQQLGNLQRKPLFYHLYHGPTGVTITLDRSSTSLLKLCRHHDTIYKPSTLPQSATLAQLITRTATTSPTTTTTPILPPLNTTVASWLVFLRIDQNAPRRSLA